MSAEATASGAPSLSSHKPRPTLSAILAARVGKKRPRYENVQELQEATVQLLNHHQNLRDLLVEISPKPSKVMCSEEEGKNRAPENHVHARMGNPILAASLWCSFPVRALQRQAKQLGVPVGLLSVRTVVERLWELSAPVEGYTDHVLLNTAKKDQMDGLLQSAKELLSLGAISRQLLCQEIWKAEKPPILEMVWRLHKENIVTLEEILESPSSSVAVEWLCADLRVLCGQPGEIEVSQQIRSDVLSVLVRKAFQESQDLLTSRSKRTPQVCFAVLDEMLSLILHTVSNSGEENCSQMEAAKLWINVFDVGLYGGTLFVISLQKFFLHTLTQILTFKPQLKVSDAVGMQWKWSFAKTCPLLTSLYRKLFVLFSVEELMAHLQQVLETHEVNWQHILSCVSTLLVCHAQAQHSLKDLLTRLLSNAFEAYDLESMITAFLLARQASLEGPAVFMSYTEWYKLSFGNASSYHGNSKKSLVFLLKFLSDLVPFEPPQYLKVHVLHPPYVLTKYRPFLLEYVSLAKTRLADLKVSIEEMGLYEDLSGTGAPAQPQCQAQQDVEKAVSLFEKTGRIPANVMEASIFRRPYFMSRFLPALLTPRLLPSKPDPRMSFIESLRNADKIPGSVYTAYVQGCQKEERQLEGGHVEVEVILSTEPLEELKARLKEMTSLLSGGVKEGDVSAHLALLSETLKSLLGETNELPTETAMKLDVDAPSSETLLTKLTNIILKSFCQNLMDASRKNPPQSQGNWASLFVKMLYGHRQLLQSLLTRLWNLLCHQGSSLSAGHVLGLSAFVVHLHESQAVAPLVDLGSLSPRLCPFAEAVSGSLLCNTEETMTFCLRFCIAAVSYGLCRCASSSVEDIQAYVPKGLFRKLLYLVPRLAAEMRTGTLGEGEESVWAVLRDPCSSWKSSALALWKHPNFQKLQQLPDLQLTFQDWLVAELDVQRSTDTLSDAERQEYQQWVCYQQYLPAPLAAGGCAGDLERACVAIMNAIVDHSIRSIGPDGHSEGLEPSKFSGTCYTDILTRLQEMVYDMELMRSKRLALGVMRDEDHFLFRVISERLATIPDRESLSGQLAQQQELFILTRIITSLPPAVLVRARHKGRMATLNCEPFFEFVNGQQGNSCARGCVLPCELTAHFFRGVLSASLDCAHPRAAVSEVLSDCLLHCPLAITSAAFWWPRLQAVLWAQWGRLCEEPLPEELQSIADCYSWASSALCEAAAPPPSDSPLVLAACLHWALERQPAGRDVRAVLGEMEEHGEQVLLFLLFFSLVDLISVKIQPKAVDPLRAMQRCADILKCFKDSGQWLALFHGQSTDQGPYQSIYKMISDTHIRLMPLAFYSLVPSLDHTLLTCVVKAPDFLRTALEMYSGLARLFLDGTASTPTQAKHTPEQVDPLQILPRAQQFVLQAISLSPQSCFLYGRQLEDVCRDLDPEVTAALSHRLQPNCDDSLYEVPDFL
ncbi:Fanconi anemia group A protein isoform X2 [Amia ocellicauda]|uniref:Fanconi anemia group A protein isoform X2 n=1 Tax=Amia ocellicauda TaxID=2972642 RepID=UPI003464B011